MHGFDRTVVTFAAAMHLVTTGCDPARPAHKFVYYGIFQGSLRAGISVAKRLATPWPLVKDKVLTQQFMLSVSFQPSHRRRLAFCIKAAT